MNGLKITNIDFSDEGYEQRFEIEKSPSVECLLLRIVDKDLAEDSNNVDATIALHASEMKALGKALVFAAEYVEGLYNE
jgi:hypothetical protein